MARRIAFYCHLLRGLGHVALSRHLGRTLARDPYFQVALITSESAPLRRPSGMKWVGLPSLREPLFEEAMVETLRERSEKIAAFIRAWQPDCLIVDQVPLGIGAELLPVFEAAEKEEWRTVFALGLAYREGFPAATGRNPRVQRAYAKYAFAFGYIESGFEPALENLPDFLKGAQCHYVGIAAPNPAAHVRRPKNDSRKRLLVLSGGGAYRTPEYLNLVIKACRPWLQKKEIQLTCIAGPLAAPWALPPSDRNLEGVTVQEEGTAEQSLAAADVVIARCGYNTAFTSIQSSAPIVFVPVGSHGLDQPNRAKKLSQLDRVWCVEEHRPTTAAELADAIAAAIKAPFAPRRLPFKTDGAERLAARLKEVL